MTPVTRNPTARLAPTADTLLLDLPGHARSAPLETPTVAAMATRVWTALSDTLADRDILLVGESLGGLVALAISALPEAARVRAAIAFDPLMSTRKLWFIKRSVRRHLATLPPGDPAFAIADHALGVTPTTTTEKIYYPLLGAVRAPAVVVASEGDGPGVFDTVDRYVAETLFGHVDLRFIPHASHLMLNDHIEECHAIISEQLDRLSHEERQSA